MGTTISELNELFQEAYQKHIQAHLKYILSPEWSVNDWLADDDITDEDIKRYPNAKKAQKLKQSKLLKALK